MSAEKPKAKRRARGGSRQDPFLRAIEVDSSLHPPSSRRGSMPSGPASSRRGSPISSPPSSRRLKRASDEPGGAEGRANALSAADIKSAAARAPSSENAGLKAKETQASPPDKQPSRTAFILFVAGFVVVVLVMFVMGVQARRARTGTDGIPVDKQPLGERTAALRPASSPPEEAAPPGPPLPLQLAPSPSVETPVPAATGSASASPTKTKKRPEAAKPTPSGKEEPAPGERPPFQFDDQNR